MVKGYTILPYNQKNLYLPAHITPFLVFIHICPPALCISKFVHDPQKRMSANIKIESGLQLLARLTRNKEIVNFYPHLFQDGLKASDVIEIVGPPCSGKSCFINELGSEALIPQALGGIGAGVLIFHTNGNINIHNFYSLLKQKLQFYNNKNTYNLDDVFQDALGQLFFVEIFNATQLYMTIYNLENYLVEHPNISMVMFDSLTAYYWSEQSFKLNKMSLYLSNLVKIIKKATKEFKVLIVYTIPEYYDANRDPKENLEEITYKISLETMMEEDETLYIAKTKGHCTKLEKHFRISDNGFQWM